MSDYASFSEIKTVLEEGKTSCVEITENSLSRIKSYNHLNIFHEVFEEEALERARNIDERLRKGTAGKLAGMIVGIKDVLCYKDHKVQASSKILDDFESQFTATAVQKLIDEDAIVIGRQNCDEFAMGSSTENSAFGPTRNYDDPERVPGGSSGASAVAVQGGFCMASLGSDTGGSVRQPAAFCGVVGLKPTYSRISRYGLIAYASSFDCIGIFTRNVADNALILEVIAGEDEYDATVSRCEVPAYSRQLNESKPGQYKIAYFKPSVETEGMQEEIKTNTLNKIETLKNAGHQVDAIDYPLLDYALPTYYILTTAEASSNLSRFDGVRYGYRSENAVNLETLYKKTRSEGFGKEVQRRIMLGTFVLSASYYDAYFTKAQKVRRLIKEAFDKLFEEYDFLISPTTPQTAFKIGAFKNNALAMYLEDLFTVQSNLTGIPAISVPNGEDQNGLPVGLQIMAQSFEEDKLLNFANSI